MPSPCKTRIRISDTVAEHVLAIMSEQVHAIQVRDLFERIGGRHRWQGDLSRLHKAVWRLSTLGLIEHATLAGATAGPAQAGASSRVGHLRTAVAYRLTHMPRAHRE